MTIQRETTEARAPRVSAGGDKLSENGPDPERYLLTRSKGPQAMEAPYLSGASQRSWCGWLDG